MEPWKFVDPSLLLYPVLALNISTERWGLEPFPSNLFAFEGFLEGGDTSRINTSNSTLFSCSVVVHAVAYKISCPYISDPLVIEAINKSTIGPTKSSIIVLTHGIVALLALLATIGVIMRFPWKRSSQSATLTTKNLFAVGQIFNPPSPAPQVGITVSFQKRTSLPTPVLPGQPNEISKEIERCAELLREMYSLDIQIWSMRHIDAIDTGERDRKAIQANNIFAEVKRTVALWQASPGSWSQEERQKVDAIAAMLARYPNYRYQQEN